MGGEFHLFALLLLPVVLLLGVGTQIRLGDARGEDVWLVIGMNRLRHAYLELAPELAPYFVAGHHDDMAGIMQTYGPDSRLTLGRVLAGTPVLVGVINAAVIGVIAALVAAALGGANPVAVGAGVVATLAYLAVSAVIPAREIARIR